MRQAIVTKWFGPTNTKGSRVKASCDAKTIIIAWDHALGQQGNHIAAAERLAKLLGWTGDWVGGSMPGTGYCFVLSAHDDEKPEFTI